jgi:CheY-like chemotaxis protein
MSTPKTIVFVEDEESIITLLRDALTALNVEIIAASRVEDGVTAVRQHHPDLVVLDLMLPVKSGWVLVDELRADPQFTDLPIIVYTSRELADEKVQGGRLDQVQEFITKPRSILELRSLIEKYLGS